MEEELKLELERAKMRNYILERENEILLGSIGLVSKDKEKLISEKESLTSELEKIKNSRSYKLAGKINKVIRRH